MNKKVLSLIAIAVIAYGVFVLLVINFYDDSPTKMKWEDREAFNKQFVANVQLNHLSFDEIIAKLGSPDITEAYQNNNYWQLMYYRTQHVKSDGITTEDECTPLLFKNNLLIAKGQQALEQFNRHKNKE